MKALIKDQPVRGATFTDRPTPQIGDNDLLVGVRAAAMWVKTSRPSRRETALRPKPTFLVVIVTNVQRVSSISVRT
jgi:hypothetical protein